MQSGKLRHRVTLQSRVAGSPQQKPTGEPDKAWADVVTVWSAVRPISGRELFLAQQVSSKVDHEIEIRYRSGVTAGMRAVFGSVIYNIDAVLNPEERNVRLILRCSTGLNKG